MAQPAPLMVQKNVSLRSHGRPSTGGDTAEIQPDPHRLAVELERLGDARLRPAARVQRGDLFVLGEPSGPGCRPPLLASGC